MFLFVVNSWIGLMFILQRSGPMLMRYFLLDFLHFELVKWWWEWAYWCCRQRLSLLRHRWSRCWNNTDPLYCLPSNFPSSLLVLLHLNLQVILLSGFVSFGQCELLIVFSFQLIAWRFIWLFLCVFFYHAIIKSSSKLVVWLLRAKFGYNSYQYLLTGLHFLFTLSCLQNFQKIKD